MGFKSIPRSKTFVPLGPTCTRITSPHWQPASDIAVTRPWRAELHAIGKRRATSQDLLACPLFSVQGSLFPFGFPVVGCVHRPAFPTLYGLSQNEFDLHIDATQIIRWPPRQLLPQFLVDTKKERLSFSHGEA